VSLDGTLIAIDRVATRNDKIATAGTLASTKPRALTTRSSLARPGYPSGRPRWHPAACTTLLPPANTALGRCMPPRPPVRRPWPTLADKGYKGACIGVHSPGQGANLPLSNANYNMLLTALRALWNARTPNSDNARSAYDESGYTPIVSATLSPPES